MCNTISVIKRIESAAQQTKNRIGKNIVIFYCFVLIDFSYEKDWKKSTKFEILFLIEISLNVAGVMCLIFYNNLFVRCVPLLLN